MSVSEAELLNAAKNRAWEVIRAWRNKPMVATGHGHDVTLIDLDERNADLARDRIGSLMFDGPIYPSREEA